MRTRTELEIVARSLEQRLRERQSEASRQPEAPLTGGPAKSETLFVFPQSTVTRRSRSEAEGPQIRWITRRIDTVQTATRAEFRLIEEESVTDSNGRPVRQHEPVQIATSTRAFDVVSTGYQRLDEDRLVERVEPFVARADANGFTEAERTQAVAELDRAASELGLSVTARMRMRIDLIDLLEGRLELGDLVARTVARQECFAETQHVALSPQCTESIEA